LPEVCCARIKTSIVSATAIAGAKIETAANAERTMAEINIWVPNTGK
jgi:hypothetical protein